MINEKQTSYSTSGAHICWTAIFAGALVGLGLGFLLNMFGMAIGLSAYSSTPGGASVIAMGGVIGLLIGVVASMGVAGYVSGYLGKLHHCYCHGGVLYGFITWSVALILSALLLMPIAHYVSYAEDNLNPGLTASFEAANAKNASVNPNVAIADQDAPTKKAMVADSKNLAMSSWLLFVLFIVGAFSSCIGACYGMRSKCGDHKA